MTGDVSADGTHAQLAVKPHPDCPLGRVAAVHRIREFRPADDSTRPQVVLSDADASAVADDPTLSPVVSTDSAVVCRLPRTDHVPCLADGFEFLPVRPYAHSFDGEWLRLRVAVTDSDIVGECIAELEAAGATVSVETVGLRTTTRSTTVIVDLEELTARQREVAELAVSRDYYDPDGAAAAELAGELGISKATLSEHLRAVREKIGSQVFLPD